MTVSTSSATRRGVLRAGLVATVAGLAAPAYIRGSLASSGELNLLIWSDEVPKSLIAAFTAATGIKINTTVFLNNEEQANKLQASFGEGYDLCMPSVQRAIEYRFLELIAPFDDKKLNLSAYIPSMLSGAQELWTWDGKLNFVPHVWGSEGLSWRSDAIDLDYASASYGLVWDRKFAGKVLLRPISGLLTLGLWLDATGKLPTNRMRDTYKDERTARKIYDEVLAFAVANKSQVKLFWDTADSVRSGFLDNGCVVGVTWDGPVQSMRKSGKPVRYIAPREGAIAWSDGWSLLKPARNVEQAYAFLNFLTKPETGAQVARDTGYNTVIQGADRFASEEDRRIFTDTYPGDALDKLWRYPAAPPWFNAVRNEYAEKFKVA